jgi:sensor domain CHASE-containing protein
MADKIIAYVDKTIVKITGLRIQGVKPNVIEQLVADQIHRPVRVIGVTGDSLQMDVYDLEPDAILRDEAGVIKAISLAPGLTVSDVAQIDSAEKARTVDMQELAGNQTTGCLKERWLRPRE